MFFNPWSIYFKSWGFAYFVIWNLYNLFGTQFVYYRFFNLILHFLNYLLIKKIISKKFDYSEKKIKLISLLFLFNPLSILTVTWIFQIKTLLSLFFILLTLLAVYTFNFNRIRDYIITIFVFFLGLTSKVSGILLPIYIGYYLYKKISNKKLLLLCIPLLTLSLLYGLLNIKGITYIVKEVKNIEKPVAEINIDHVIMKSQYALTEEERSTESDVNYEINIYNEISEGAEKYLPPVFNLNTFFDKHIVSMQNLSKLVLFTFGLNSYFPFYENNLQTSLTNSLFFHVTIASIFLLILIKTKNQFLILALTLFLPVAGYFYIPYMKFSYTSDHWFYPACFAIILGITSFIKNRKILAILSLAIFANYAYTTTTYYNFSNTLSNNYASIPNNIVIDHLTNYQEAFPDKDKIALVYDKILSESDFNNTSYYKQLHKSVIDSGNLELLKKHFPRFAADQIRSQDSVSLYGFGLMHEGIYPSEKLELTKSLLTVFSHHISKERYRLVLDYLK
jgi:hypothetical protein